MASPEKHIFQIVGNWKMSPDTQKEAMRLFERIKPHAQKAKYAHTTICPPFLYIPQLARNATGRKLHVGAQDVFWRNEGSYTGEISAPQLSDGKAYTVIVGHSERRALGETSEEVSKKVSRALSNGLTVIVCVGESERDDSGDYARFVSDQVRNSLTGVQKSHLNRVMIAYEPIWAIGKQAKHAATPSDVLEMTIFIKKTLADMFGQKYAEPVQFLYGGSVDEKNARAFLADSGIDGVLIGRASRDPKKMEQILAIADEVAKEK